MPLRLCAGPRSALLAAASCSLPPFAAVCHGFKDSVKLYVAPFGVGYFGKKRISAYGGIQTRSDGYRFPALEEKGGCCREIGRGCIFSRWDSRDTADVEVPSDGFWCSGGEAWSGEGDFLSARVCFPWTSNTPYTFRVCRESSDRTHSWLGLRATGRPWQHAHGQHPLLQSASMAGRQSSTRSRPTTLLTCRNSSKLDSWGLVGRLQSYVNCTRMVRALSQSRLHLAHTLAGVRFAIGRQTATSAMVRTVPIASASSMGVLCTAAAAPTPRPRVKKHATST